MSVVRINAITVPKERADELEAASPPAGEVSSSPGFEAFELLAPGRRPRHVTSCTRAGDRGGLPGWVSSPAFQHGHQAHGDRAR